MKKEKTSMDVLKDKFPGYPYYPVKEDILSDRELNAERVPVDLENISRNVDLNTTLAQLSDNDPVQNLTSAERKNDFEIVSGNDADVTSDDLAALGNDELNMDMGDDELLKNRAYPSIMGDSDLDIPGAELDDFSEDFGNEDEENNYYSLGGDNHEK